MTISEKLQQVNEIKEGIRDAVNEKGGVLPSSAPFADFRGAVLGIPQEVVEGGGNLPWDFGNWYFGSDLECNDLEIGTFKWGFFSSGRKVRDCTLMLRLYSQAQTNNTIIINFGSLEIPLDCFVITRNNGNGNWYSSRLTGSASISMNVTSAARAVTAVLNNNTYGDQAVILVPYIKIRDYEEEES